MQDINVYNSTALTNANNIKNAFDNYVTGYFTSVEVDSTTSNDSVYVNFYIEGKETPGFQLRIMTNTSLYDADNRVRVGIGNSWWWCNQSSSNPYQIRVYGVCATDNGVSIYFSGANDAYVCTLTICKAENDDVLLFFVGSNGGLYSMNAGSTTISSQYVYVYRLLDDTYTASLVNVQTNANNQVWGVPVVHRVSGPSKNVFMALNRCYSGIREPFLYQINGENYVGTWCNAFIIKSD